VPPPPHEKEKIRGHLKDVEADPPRTEKKKPKTLKEWIKGVSPRNNQRGNPNQAETRGRPKLKHNQRGLCRREELPF